MNDTRDRSATGSLPVDAVLDGATASHPSGDAVLEQFIAEMDRRGAERLDLDGWIERHPDRERELRELVRLRQTLDENNSEPPIPETMGEFRIIRLISRGGMGDVYLAEQVSLKRPVAVKVIRHGSNSEDARQRFLREQEVLAGLHQTNIVPVHTAGQDGDLQYFAMPYIEGAALHHVLRAAAMFETSADGRPPATLGGLARCAFEESTASLNPEPTCDGRLPAIEPQSPPVSPLTYFRSVARVIADAAEAVHHAHEAGVLHRDLKPSNIMIDRHERVWLIDFGLSRFLEAKVDGGPAAAATGDGAAPSLTNAAGMTGTPPYMAPEQFGDDPASLDRRTDVWGLGATLYELLTQTRAFPGENPADIRRSVLHQQPCRPRFHVPGIPRDLEAITQRAMQKEPSARYASASDMAEDLRRWLRSEPVAARPARPVRRAWLWSKRNPGWAATLVLAVAALLALSIGAVLHQRAIAAASNATAAESAARERDREHISIIQQMQLLRGRERRDGWTDEIRELARKAAAIRRDESLQSQVAASLAGIDARSVKRFDFTANSVAFDRGKPGPDRLLIGGSRDRGAAIWNSRSDRLQTTARRGGGPVAFDAQGSPLQLLASDIQTLLLWDVANQRMVREFRLPAAPRPDAETGKTTLLTALAADASFVAAAGVFADAGRPEGKPALLIWDARSGKLVGESAQAASALAFAADGSLFAAGDDQGRVHLWSLPGARPLPPLQSSRVGITALAFGRYPRRRIADRKGDIAASVRGANGDIAACAGWKLAAATSGGSIVVWDLERRAPVTVCKGSYHAVYSLAFNSDGTVLASGGRWDVRLWDAASGKPLLTWSAEGIDYVTGLAFSADDRRLAAVQKGTRKLRPPGVVVLEIESNRGIRSLRGLSDFVADVRVSPDGRYVAAVSQNWQVGVWSLADGRLRHIFEVPEGRYVDNVGVAFSGDGRRFLIAAGTTTRLWDLTVGKQLGEWKLPPGLQDRPAFHPRHGMLLIRFETKDAKLAPYSSAPPEKHPRVVRVRTLDPPDRSRLLYEIHDFNDRIEQIVVPADGHCFAVFGRHNGVDGRWVATRFFDATTGKLLWSIPRGGHVDGFVDTTSRVVIFENQAFETASGRVLQRLPIRATVLSPDAKYLVGAGANVGLAKRGFGLYDRGSARRLVTLSIDSSPTSAFRFDLTSRLLAWPHADGTISVADLPEIRRRLAEFGLGW